MISGIILRLIDPFYPLFRRFLDLQTYRYGVCGALNTAFDLFLYFIFYNFILQKQITDLGYFAISPHIAAFFMAFVISFPSGFFLMRLVVFPESTIRGRVQLIRYFSVVVVNIFLNYTFLKVLVEFFGFYPTPSKLIITCMIVGITYLLQKHFTFREKPVGERTSGIRAQDPEPSEEEIREEESRQEILIN